MEILQLRFAYPIDNGGSEADVAEIYAGLLEQVLGQLQAFYLEESSAFVDYLPPKAMVTFSTFVKDFPGWKCCNFTKLG